MTGRQLARSGRLGQAGFVFLIVTTISMLACATSTQSTWQESDPPVRREDGPGAGAVRDVRARYGSFFDCPDRGCFEAAARNCTAVHFLNANWTVEGEPVFTDYFVVPKGADDCTVLVVDDYSEDAWGNCSVTVRSCPSLCAAYFLSRTEKCAPEEVLFKSNCCGNWKFARPGCAKGAAEPKGCPSDP